MESVPEAEEEVNNERKNPKTVMTQRPRNLAAFK
jgi:hypothetical protein